MLFSTCQVTRVSNQWLSHIAIKPEHWFEFLCAFLSNLSWGQHHFLFGIKLPLQKPNYHISSSTFWFTSATPQPHKEAVLDTALSPVLARHLHSCCPSHSKVHACHLHLNFWGAISSLGWHAISLQPSEGDLLALMNERQKALVRNYNGWQQKGATYIGGDSWLIALDGAPFQLKSRML